MRILVTRPETSAVRTGERLRALGHEPVFLPLFQAEFDAEGAAKARALTGIQAILMTSAQAIRAVGMAGELAEIPLFAVGASTAKAAIDAGFKHVEAANGDGAALAEILRKRFAGHDKPALLYIAGEPRSPRLEQELAAARFPVEVAVCYRMRPVDLTGERLQAAFEPRPQAVLLYSSEAARRFFDIAPPLVEHSPDIEILCLSPAIAEVVPASMKSRIKYARRPDEMSLFELL